jgi:hypothetical protein
LTYRSADGAYRAGVPGNGKPFPDGSKVAKIHWNAKKSADAPNPTTVPDTLHDVDFMVRDGKRFPETGGWGWAEFDYDRASDTFTPLGSGTNCGYECHTIAKAKDYVFTTYGRGERATALRPLPFAPTMLLHDGAAVEVRLAALPAQTGARSREALPSIEIAARTKQS